MKKFGPGRLALVGFIATLASQAIVAALAADGLVVERATIASQTSGTRPGALVIVVASNTYWWTQDRPTLRYLDRVRWDGLPVLGIDLPAE